MKKILLSVLLVFLLRVSSVLAVTPTLSIISVGNSTIYLDDYHSWQEQQLASSSASDAENDPLTLICCEDNSSTCTPSIDNAACIDYKSAPYNFICSYEPSWNFPPSMLENPSLEETRYLRCAVNDSTESSLVISTSYQTSFDCQDGSENPVLPALAEGCHMRSSLTLQDTPLNFTHLDQEYPNIGDGGVIFDTDDVTLDCNNNLYDITDASDPKEWSTLYVGMFPISANGLSIKNCDFKGGNVFFSRGEDYTITGCNWEYVLGFVMLNLEGGKRYVSDCVFNNIEDQGMVSTMFDQGMVKNFTIRNSKFYVKASDNPDASGIELDIGGPFNRNGGLIGDIVIENNEFYIDGGQGTYYAIKEFNDDAHHTEFRNFVIKDNYIEDGQISLKFANGFDPNIKGTIIVEGNTWLGVSDKPLVSLWGSNAFFARGGNIDYAFRNNNVSRWYNSTAVWDEAVCGSGYPVPVNAPGWFCSVEGISAIFGQFVKSIRIENNDFKDIQGYVALLRNIYANGITVYDNNLVDASGIYVRDSNGANITHNNVTETANIAVVEPVVQSLSRFCYFRNSNNGICRDNNLTSNHGVLFRAREASNNTDVSFNTFNYIDIPGLEYQGNATHDAYYYWGGDVTYNAVFQIRGRAGQNIIQNNTINDLPDGDYSFEVSSNGMATNPEIRGTDNEFKYNIFNENVNQFNYELNGALDNIVDDLSKPNYWAKPPEIISIECNETILGENTTCMVNAGDVRWYDMVEAVLSIIKDVTIISGAVVSMTNIPKTDITYVFTAGLLKEAGLWTANATVSDALGGTGEDSTTFNVISLDNDDDGVLDDVDKCENTVQPEAGVPTDNLNPEHFVAIFGNNYFQTNIGSKAQPNIVDSQYSLADTYGCTCEQILSCKPGENLGEYKFGCSHGTISVWIAQTGWSLDC